MGLTCAGMTAFLYIPHIGSYTLSWPVVAFVGLFLLVKLAAKAGRTTVEFSADHRQYRQGWQLLGLQTGTWKPLPPVVGVTLKYFSTTSSEPVAGIDSWGTWNTSTTRHEKLVLLLSLQNSATGLIIDEYGPDDLAAAREAAQALAARFGVEVREYLVPQRTRRR